MTVTIGLAACAILAAWVLLRDSASWLRRGAGQAARPHSDAGRALPPDGRRVLLCSERHRTSHDHWQNGVPWKVGIVGLGCGTLAAYGRAGDTEFRTWTDDYSTMFSILK